MGPSRMVTGDPEPISGESRRGWFDGQDSHSRPSIELFEGFGFENGAHTTPASPSSTA